jgi:uncharacterized protein YecE (DUF72 family)
VIWVGTSGYNYPEWRGSFYPEGFPTADMLPFYAQRFTTVEINFTSYHFPTEKSLRGWAAATPADFKFALKVPRWITFGPTAFRAAGPLRSFTELATLLGEKLGSILLQLPEGFPHRAGLLEALLPAVPSNVASAIEIRHASWHRDDVFELLRQHHVGVCISDSEELTTPVVATANIAYFRLRNEGYSAADLRAWAEQVRVLSQRCQEVFVYFKHEATGSGPRFACLLLEQLSAAAGG